MMGIYAIIEKKEGCAMTDKFNENLKKARQNAHMTQEEVAVKIGVAKNTYCNWELGTRN